MSEDDFTAEETAAMEAMENDQGQAEEAPQPEQPAEVSAEPPQEQAEEQARQAKPPEGFVPHAALHAERMRNREMAEKLAALEKWKQEQEVPPEPEPEYRDPLEDPDGFRKWAEANQRKTTEPLQQFMEQQRAAQEHQQRVQMAAQAEAEFAKTTPDYNDAATFVQRQRVEELRGMGYTDPMISQQLRQDAINIFTGAQQAGMNPAQLLYLRAQQAGFKPKAQQQAERMQAQAKAQEQTRTLGQASGAPAGGKLTAAQLAEMSDDEFEKLSEDDLRAVMGG